MLLDNYINIPTVQKIGVYAIHNKANNKYYIGSSTNIYNRLVSHNSSGTNHDIIIDRCKYPAPCWELIILKTFDDGSITADELTAAENYYIKKYNSIKSGYNRRPAFNIRKKNDLLYCRRVRVSDKKTQDEWQNITIPVKSETIKKIKAATGENINDFIYKLVNDYIKTI